MESQKSREDARRDETLKHREPPLRNGGSSHFYAAASQMPSGRGKDPARRAGANPGFRLDNGGGATP